MSLIAVHHATSEAAPIKITNQKTVAETIIEEMKNEVTKDEVMIKEEMIDAVIAEIVEVNAAGLAKTAMAEVGKGLLIVVISIIAQVAISNPIALPILSAKALIDKA